MPARSFAFAALLAGAFATAQAPAPPSAREPALGGRDPVALCRGKELAGGADRTVQRGDAVYRFANDENRAAFAADPERFEIQMDGACARMGPLSGAGSPQRFLVHGERIYVFASDACRDTFGKRPDTFLDPDDPEPAGDTKARDAGEQLLARTLAAHGGEERLLAWRTYRHERRAGTGELRDEFRMQLQLPGTARLDHDVVQGPQTWRNAHVITPAAAFLVERDVRHPIGPAGHRELERQLSHEPLWALRLALDAPHVAVARGPRTVAGVQVDELELWQRGASTTFGIGSDDRIRTARFRGRGPAVAFGAVELVFDDFRTIAGLVVPATVDGTFDGAKAPLWCERRDKIDVDVDLPAELFAPK